MSSTRKPGDRSALQLIVRSLLGRHELLPGPDWKPSARDEREARLHALIEDFSMHVALYVSRGHRVKMPGLGSFVLRVRKTQADRPIVVFHATPLGKFRFDKQLTVLPAPEEE